MQGNPPFDENPVETIPDQGHTYMLLDLYMVALDGTEIPSTADLKEGGYNLFPGGTGTSTRTLVKEIWQEVGIWEKNNIIELPNDDSPGAVAEGRIDAFVAMGINLNGLFGYTAEIDARIDKKMHLVKTSDEYVEAVKKAIGSEPIPNHQPQRFWESDISSITNSTTAWSLTVAWCYSPQISPDATYEIAKIVHENADEIKAKHEATIDYSEAKNMMQTLSTRIPVHKGYADYYKEVGVWNDQLKIGE
jgi:TRAP-type uncharacterized transport system substrate-binding protein